MKFGVESVEVRIILTPLRQYNLARRKLNFSLDAEVIYASFFFRSFQYRSPRRSR
jgi:hypothetical protein